MNREVAIDARNAQQGDDSGSTLCFWQRFRHIMVFDVPSLRDSGLLLALTQC
jgi:hypothetical protein